MSLLEKVLGTTDTVDELVEEVAKKLLPQIQQEITGQILPRLMDLLQSHKIRVLIVNNAIEVQVVDSAG